MTLRTAQIIRVVITRERVCVCFSLWRQLSLLVMQGYNMCRWCYFSCHFTLGLKGSAVIVTLARVAWHILKWPLALSLGVLTLLFFSCSNSLCYDLHTVHLLNSLCLPCSYLSVLPAPSPHCSPSPLFILSCPLLSPILLGDTYVLSGP